MPFLGGLLRQWHFEKLLIALYYGDESLGRCFAAPYQFEGYLPGMLQCLGGIRKQLADFVL